MQTPHPLDGVHMSELARARAKAHMRRAEFIVELVAHGVSKMRSVVTLVARRPGDIARRLKLSHQDRVPAS